MKKRKRAAVFENGLLRKKLWPERDEVTGEWRELHIAKGHDVQLIVYHSGNQMMEDEMGEACGPCGGKRNAYMVFLREYEEKRKLVGYGNR